MSRKLIQITVCVEVPSSATDQEIKDYLDVEIAGCNSYKQDNPCAVEGVEFVDLKVN